MRSLGLRKYLRVASAICHNFVKGEAIFPFYASLKLTNRCHFRCSFCNVWKEKIPELPAPEFCKLLENLGRSSVILVSFEGGEPLLREDLEELLKFARTQPFYLLFTTNDAFQVFKSCLFSLASSLTNPPSQPAVKIWV